jgi:hypothetical protein
MLFVVSWNIKSQIEESIRLMELEEAEFMFEDYAFDQDEEKQADKAAGVPPVRADGGSNSPMHSGKGSAFSFGDSDTNASPAEVQLADMASASSSDPARRPAEVRVVRGLYHVDPADRVNRYSSAAGLAMGRATRVGLGLRPSAAGGAGQAPRMTGIGGGGRMSTLDSGGNSIRIPLSHMFVPAPIDDPDDEIRISVFSPV